MTFTLLCSCQKDLTVQTMSASFSAKNGANDAVTIVKNESLPNDVFKTTYSNGIQVYLWPNEKGDKSEKNQSFTTPSQCSYNGACNTGINDEGLDSEGCCCLRFYGFVSAPFSSGIRGFLWDINTYYSFPTATPHDYRFYLKITVPTSNGPLVWYENYLPWEDGQLPSCTDTYSRYVVWPSYPFCNGDINVIAKKVFRRLDVPSDWSSCAETHCDTYYEQPFPQPCL